MESPRNQRRKESMPRSMATTAVMGVDPIIEERIRFHAYLLFQERQRTGAPGDALSDWCRAEHNLGAGVRTREKTGDISRTHVPA